MALFISSPITCMHAVIGSTIGMVSGKTQPCMFHSLLWLQSQCPKEKISKSVPFHNIEPNNMNLSDPGRVTF